MSSESKGNWFIIASIFFWSFFPVFAKMSINGISPLMSYFYSTIFAGIPFLFLATSNKRFKELIDLKVIRDSFLAAVWIGVIFYGLYFFSLNITKAGNASIAALSEILWSYLFFNLWKKEYLKAKYIFGAVFMLVGTLIVLIPKSSGWYLGDTILLFATAAAPFGNFFQRRARERASSESVLFLRIIFTGIMVGIILLVSGQDFNISGSGISLWFLVLNGILTLGLSKIFWLEGIFRISVTKALAISALTPFLTLIFSYLILGEVPTMWQFASLLPMMIGMILLTTNFTLGFRKNQDKMNS